MAVLFGEDRESSIAISPCSLRILQEVIFQPTVKSRHIFQRQTCTVNKAETYPYVQATERHPDRTLRQEAEPWERPSWVLCEEECSHILPFRGVQSSITWVNYHSSKRIASFNLCVASFIPERILFAASSEDILVNIDILIYYCFKKIHQSKIIFFFFLQNIQVLCQRGLPWQSRGYNSPLPLKGTWVQSLVREPRSLTHEIPWGEVKKKGEGIGKLLNWIKVKVWHINLKNIWEK